MNHEQPQRPRATATADDDNQSVKYGDVFHVTGELASNLIAPQDEASMQSAENMVLGKAQKGGTAAIMQSAAAQNEKAGVVAHREMTNVARDQGVTVSESVVDGKRIVTEFIGGQIVGQYYHLPPVRVNTPMVGLDSDTVTIGEALEASALSAGNKPVDQSDAAAIQAAEVRACGTDFIKPGGIAAEAQTAANFNALAMRDEEKTKIADVLTDATEKLPKDRPVTAGDAEGVIGAELMNNPNMSTFPDGVAETIAAAAGLNQNK